jgi:hypothetical protein
MLGTIRQAIGINGYTVVIAALLLSAAAAVARADMLSFTYSPLENLEPFRTDPTPYLGAQPWLTVEIQTNGSPTQSATSGTLTITPGSGWVSGETLNILGLNVLSSLVASTFEFNGSPVSSTGIDTGGTFDFGFGPVSASPSISYSITSTSSFWNAASFEGKSSGGSVNYDNVNYGPYNFYSEAILSNDLYIYAPSYTYALPEPSRIAGVVGMAIMGGIGLCFGYARKRKPIAC